MGLKGHIQHAYDQDEHKCYKVGGFITASDGIAMRIYYKEASLIEPNYNQDQNHLTLNGEPRTGNGNKL